MNTMNASRIPDFSDKSFDGMLMWFSEMSVRDLLFHPDDAPETIISIATGEKFFTATECRNLESTLATMFRQFGSDVYEAAYPIFMKRMNIQLDA
ncbi:MAG: hypothetical protein Q8L89_09275 [Gammaproteobacteria bacterium]|nr:hypothetical protein [Gammaproteobacteria bacterium]